jgi:HSP20 family protein
MQTRIATVSLLRPTRGERRVGFEEEFEEIHRRVDRLIRDLSPYRVLLAPARAWSPPMDIYETAQEFVVVIEIAGAEPENLELTFEGSILVIRGTREPLAAPGCGKCHQMEVDTGSFEKRIRVPFEVEKERAASHYKDGLLTVVLPKTRNKLNTQIEISGD